MSRRAGRSGPRAMTKCRMFSCRPELTQSISILTYDHRDFPYFLLFVFSGNKISIGMFTYVAHFDRKVGIYIATKLFQFTSWKEPSNPSRTDGFFRRCSRRRVRPSLIRGFSQLFCNKSARGAVRVI